MKRIYFTTIGYSACILSQKCANTNSYGYYWVRDILGTEHYFPIANSYLSEEEWDGKTEGLDRRFWDIAKELQGVATGTLTTQKK